MARLFHVEAKQDRVVDFIDRVMAGGIHGSVEAARRQVEARIHRGIFGWSEST